jgi:Ca2+-binding EF-hand superfamily protein
MLAHHALCAPDTDKSGTLEIEELQTALKDKLGVEKTKEEIESVFAEVKGEDADLKSVDFANFKKIVENFKAADAKAKEAGPSE